MVTVAWTGDVPGETLVRKGRDGYRGNTVGNWGGTDGRRGLDAVGVT